MSSSVQPLPGTTTQGSWTLVVAARLAQLVLAGGALAVAAASGGNGPIFTMVFAPAAAIECVWTLTVLTTHLLLRNQKATLTHPLWLRTVTLLDHLAALVALGAAMAALGIATYIRSGDHCARHPFNCTRFKNSETKLFFLWLALQAPSASFLVYDLNAYANVIRRR